jgi:hypothetical protein
MTQVFGKVRSKSANGSISRHAGRKNLVSRLRFFHFVTQEGLI